MMKFTSNYWSLLLPESWGSEEDDTCVTFTSQSVVGALQVSSALNSNGLATDEDLYEFADDHIQAGAKLREIAIGDFTGFYLKYSVDDMYQRQWWLRSKNIVVFATYTCDLIDKDTNDNIIDGIMNTLQRKE